MSHQPTLFDITPTGLAAFGPPSSPTPDHPPADLCAAAAFFRRLADQQDARGETQYAQHNRTEADALERRAAELEGLSR